jgi:hypothetical protein
MGDVVLQAIVDTYGASPSRSPLRPDLPSYLVKPEDNLLGGISEVVLDDFRALSSACGCSSWSTKW